MSTVKRNLLVDVNNLTFMTRHIVLPQKVAPRRKDKHADKLICFSMIKFILTSLEKLRCSGLVLAVDSKNVWRKDIFPEYKASSTTSDDAYYSDCLEAANLLKTIFRDHTAATVLTVPRCEADDIIGWWCHNTTNEAVILSNDSDYKQLHSDLVRQYSPTHKDFVSCTDPGYQLFLKCIRGDLKSDNIPSAYPRVRETVIKGAFEDSVNRANLMETVLKDGTKVGDSFKRNETLIDLSKQPDEIKQQIARVINTYESGKFKQIGMMQFIGNTMGVKKYAEIFDKSPKAVRVPPQLLSEE